MSNDKIREAIVDAYRCGVAHGKSFPDLTGVKLAVAVEDYLCRPEVIVALTQQPESEPADIFLEAETRASNFYFSSHSCDTKGRRRVYAAGFEAGAAWQSAQSQPTPQVPKGWVVHSKVNAPADQSGQRIIGYRVTLPEGGWCGATDWLPDVASPSIAEKPQPNKENQND